MQKPFDIAKTSLAQSSAVDLDALADSIKPQKLQPNKPRDALLVSREPTHGDYIKTAELAQNLKIVCRNGHGYGNLTAVQRESLDMICTKLARVLCGNPDHDDHWIDIAGYANLVKETLG